MEILIYWLHPSLRVTKLSYMTNKFDYKRPYCEVCGAIGPNVSVEGWNTCEEHFREDKPSEPVFDWQTGDSLIPSTIF